MSDSNNNNNSASGAASVIHGHLAYVQGAVTSALGNTDSGAAKKEEAVKEMKEAQAQSDSPPAKPSLAEKVGKAVGCPGLEDEGQQSGSLDSTGTSSVGPSGGAIGEKQAASRLGKL